jgi:hypothetical protein
LFALAVPTGRTRRTTLPIVGVTQNTLVINVEHGLAGIGIEPIPEGSTIVTDQFTIPTRGEAGGVARRKFTGDFIVTNIRGGMKGIKNDATTVDWLFIRLCLLSCGNQPECEMAMVILRTTSNERTEVETSNANDSKNPLIRNFKIPLKIESWVLWLTFLALLYFFR